MKKDGFGAASPGRLLGIGDGAFAFLPQPLPPEGLSLEPVMVEMSEAMQVIGRLQGRGTDLPNPDLLIRPLHRSEALASSRMEGTIADPKELALTAAKAKPEPAEGSGDDIREVLNYGVALHEALFALAEMPITHSMIRGIHKRLLSGLSAARGARKDPGEYRRRQCHIGYENEIRFTPPPALEAEAAMDELVGYVRRQDAAIPALVDAALVHYQFEAIHPFADGNGRVGRILIPIFLAARGVLERERPLFYPSVVLERRRQEYIDRLLGVSRDGDWLGWIRFFLQVAKQGCEETLEKSERIFALLEEYKRRLADRGRSQNPVKLAESLFRQPVVSIPEVAELCQVTYPSARGLVERMMQAGILKEFPDERPRRFFAEEVIALY